MLHTIGVGTVWRRKNVLTGAGTADPTFIGAKCRAAFQESGGMGVSVPVENQGGGGTRDSHWRERSLGRELMTGYVSPSGKTNPFSRITVASLEDLGYDVDYAGADPYTVSPFLLATEEVLVPRPHCLSTVPFSA